MVICEFIRVKLKFGRRKTAQWTKMWSKHAHLPHFLQWYWALLAPQIVHLWFRSKQKVALFRKGKTHCRKFRHMLLLKLKPWILFKNRWKLSILQKGNPMDFIKISLEIDDFVQNSIHQKWCFFLHLRKYPKRSKSATIFQFFHNLFSQAKWLF